MCFLCDCSITGVKHIWSCSENWQFFDSSFLILKFYVLIMHVPYLHNLKRLLHFCFPITVYLPKSCSDEFKLNNYWVKVFARRIWKCPKLENWSWVFFSMKEQHCHLSLRNWNADAPQQLAGLVFPESDVSHVCRWYKPQQDSFYRILQPIHTCFFLSSCDNSLEDWLTSSDNPQKCVFPSK